MSGSFSTYNSTYNWTDTRKYQSTNNGFFNIFCVHYSPFSELLSIVSTVGGRWHSRGQRFDPAYLHQQNRTSVRMPCFCFVGGDKRREKCCAVQKARILSSSRAALMCGVLLPQAKENPQTHGGGFAAGVSRIHISLCKDFICQHY